MDPTPLTHWLWKHGLTLHAARLKFGHPELVERCKAAMRIPILPEPDAIKPMREAGDIAPVLQGMAERARARADAFDALETCIVGYLEKGLLKGLGYELPRRVADEPVAIPVEAWEGRIDFAASTVKHAGLELVEVRLITARWEKELSDRWYETYAPAPRQKRRGPVGTARRIEEAYVVLRDAGQIDFTASMSCLYPRVRQWLMAHFPGEGFSEARPHDETLRKTISPMFSQDRESNTQ